MEKYIGTREIEATPMTREEYNLYRGWELPSDENGSDEGYLVEYKGDTSNHVNHTGYISWSPKKQFEEAYIKPVDTLADIGSEFSHEQRVIWEANELHDKIVKLHDFIESNPIFENIPPAERCRLKMQLLVMRQYFSVLSNRIAEFKGVSTQKD
jgi:hypothetical protein